MINDKEIPVVCAIIEKDNRILAAQRGEMQTNAGLWEFPGGKVDPGETPEQALKREITEELTVDIMIHRQLIPVSYRYPWISIKLIPFVCSINNGIVAATEHKSVVFVNKKESEDLVWAPADVIVLNQYFGK